MKATNMNQLAKMIEDVVVAGMEVQEAETKGDLLTLHMKQPVLFSATVAIGVAVGDNADFLLDLQKKFDSLMSHLNAEDNQSAIEFQEALATIVSDRTQGY